MAGQHGPEQLLPFASALSRSGITCSPARAHIVRDTGVTSAGECATCEALAEVPSITSPCPKTHNDRALHRRSRGASRPQSLALAKIILRWDSPGTRPAHRGGGFWCPQRCPQPARLLQVLCCGEGPCCSQCPSQEITRVSNPCSSSDPPRRSCLATGTWGSEETPPSPHSLRGRRLLQRTITLHTAPAPTPGPLYPSLGRGCPRLAGVADRWQLWIGSEQSPWRCDWAAAAVKREAAAETGGSTWLAGGRARCLTRIGQAWKWLDHDWRKEHEGGGEKGGAGASVGLAGGMCRCVVIGWCRVAGQGGGEGSLQGPCTELCSASAPALAPASPSTRLCPDGSGAQPGGLGRQGAAGPPGPSREGAETRCRAPRCPAQRREQGSALSTTSGCGGHGNQADQELCGWVTPAAPCAGHRGQGQPPVASQTDQDGAAQDPPVLGSCRL